MKRIIIIFIFSLIALFIVNNCAIANTPISWEPDFDPNAYDGSLGSIDAITLNDDSPLAFAINIVNWVASFLGFLFLILIMYAGYVWFMARGNEEEVTKAQTILKRAIIGLIIVLLSVSISYLLYWLVSSSVVKTSGTTSPVYTGSK